MAALPILLACLVVGVTDGDTIKARCGDPGAYEQVTVRLNAIDAPERKQAYGQRSREALSGLCFEQQARLRPSGKDRYGRVVANVECREQDAGRFMVGGGWAWVYDRYAKGYEYLYPVQAEARAARRGLWADKDPVPPWLYRKARKNPTAGSLAP
ncbi:thermonuclease family protein [Bordetella hinzii]|uniref:thermonuclease family protein n=1 Tax=Bordetella hinzii TaxID=103855 RepID=UPI000764BA61|nr:thermonuclease family protein [Bordetella hinzii]KXA71068.1 hypothetical protein AXA74_20410 [Bordetella hinzii LMG 13501]VEH23177.1 nuclease [Bordetella hinzii]